MIVFLLLTLAISGCIEQPETEPGLPHREAFTETEEGTETHSAMGDEEGTSPLDWTLTISNNTYLVRVNTTENVTIQNEVPHTPPNLYHTAFTILEKHVKIHLHARIGFGADLAIQDNEFYLPQDDQPSRPRFIEREIGPGEYHIILDSKGVETTFTVQSENGTLEILAVDPDMGTFRTSYDDAWDHHERVKVQGREYFHATTTIPLKHNFTLTQLLVRGDEWEFDYGSRCHDRRQIHEPLTSAFWYLWSQDEIDLRVKFNGLPTGGIARFYTLDLPLDPPEDACLNIWES